MPSGSSFLSYMSERKTKNVIGGSRVYLNEQLCYGVDLFALKFDLCVSYLIIIHISIHSIMAINIVLFYEK